MLSASTSAPARRTRRQAERRTRRRPVFLAGSLALGVAVAACVTGMAPAAGADAVADRDTRSSYALASYDTSMDSITVTVTGDSDPVVAQAGEAIAEADAVVTAAASVTAEVASSGLDVGDPDPTVDTAELESSLAALREAEAQNTPLLPALTENVSELVSPVDERVTQLRGSLEGAKARKAAEEEAARVAAEAAAAAAAKAEAEAAAAAKAKPVAPRPSGSSAPLPAPTGGGSGDNSPAGAQASARAMLAGYGWGDDQFGCLVSLWNKESGWNYLAHNSSSGAHGIPQALPGGKMASAGADWQTNAATQVAWGLGYISGRYGTPCGAWSHSQSVGWY
jgi:hypothetical protein